MKGVMRGILATFQSVAMTGSVIGTVSSGYFWHFRSFQDDININIRIYVKIIYI